MKELAARRNLNESPKAVGVVCVLNFAWSGYDWWMQEADRERGEIDGCGRVAFSGSLSITKRSVRRNVFFYKCPP